MTLRTVGDLLEALDGIDPATPLRHAQQPRYPFEWTIGGVELVQDLAENGPVAGLPPRRGRRGAGVGPMSMTTVDRLIADTHGQALLPKFTSSTSSWRGRNTCSDRKRSTRTTTSSSAPSWRRTCFSPHVPIFARRSSSGWESSHSGSNPR
jgi:hypothetical protein